MSEKEKLIEQIKIARAKIQEIDSREREKKVKTILGSLLIRELKAERVSITNIEQWLSNKSTPPKDKQLIKKYLTVFTNEDQVRNNKTPEKNKKQKRIKHISQANLNKKGEEPKIQIYYRPTSLYQMRLFFLAVFKAKKDNKKISSKKELIITAKDINKLSGDIIKTDYRKLARVANEFKKINIILKHYKNKKTNVPTITTINLTEFCEYIDGEGYVRLKFAPEIIPYITTLSLDITEENIQYIMNMKSSYGIRLYELCLQWIKSGNKQIIEVPEFRKLLGLENKYPLIGTLKDRIVKPAIKDINKYSDFYISLQEYKTSRAISHFKFFIKNNTNNGINKKLN